MTVGIDKLIRMGEQITANMSFVDDKDVVSDKVADHLGRFWDPRMKASIIEYAGDHGEAFSEPLLMAIDKLKAA
jgi:formate dehydrogenase subunit delta